jgi:hypothetical protein
MQVGSGHATLWVPVIGHDLPANAIIESVRVRDDADAPGSTLSGSLDEAVGHPDGQAEPVAAEPDGIVAEAELAGSVRGPVAVEFGED